MRYPTKAEALSIRRVIDGYVHGHAILVSDAEIARRYGITKNHELTAKGKAMARVHKAFYPATKTERYSPPPPPSREELERRRAAESRATHERYRKMSESDPKAAIERVVRGHAHGLTILVSDEAVAAEHGYVTKTRPRTLTAKGRALAERLPRGRSYDENPTTGQTAAIAVGLGVLALGAWALFVGDKGGGGGSGAGKKPPSLAYNAVVGQNTPVDDKTKAPACLPPALVDSFNENSLFLVRPVAAGEKALGELAPFGLTAVPDPNKLKLGSTSPSGSVYQPSIGIYPKSRLVEAIAAAKAARAAGTANVILVSRGFKAAPCVPPAPALSQTVTFLYWVAWNNNGPNEIPAKPPAVQNALRAPARKSPPEAAI
jgi:hypothetical protein